MTIHDTASTAQAVRRIHENGHAVIDNGAGTIQIVCQPDTSSGKNILLWDDIKAVFGNALYVRSGDFALPYLKGPDFKNLDPLRIAAIPGVTLDVVVTGPAVDASPPSSAFNQIAQQAAQFPIYNPFSTLQSHPWIPTSHFTTDNNIPHTFNHHRAPVLLTSRTQPNDIATQTHRRALELNKVKAIIRKIAVCTDLEALHAKGDGRPQDFQKALECYLKTVQKGQAQALISVGDLFLTIKLFNKVPPLPWVGISRRRILVTTMLVTKLINFDCKELPRLFSSSQAPLLEELKDAQQDKHQDKDTAGNSSLGATTVTAGEPASSPNQNDSSVPLQGVLPSPTLFTLELANMMARAESRNHVAQEALGDMCLDGRVVRKDVQAAIDWYLRADSGGSSTAIKKKLRPICLSNLGVTQEYLMALDRHHKAVVQGGVTAQRNLGGLYLAAQDYTQALTWCRKAAEQGDTTAQNNTGYLYDEGLGVSQDHVEAMTWYRKAAEQGYATAQYNIGTLYQQGLGVSQDYAAAMTWYRKAAEQGYAAAQYHIGLMFENGLGVTKDKLNALEWYKKAAEQGVSDAENAVLNLEREGYSVHGSK
ncbi:HCP-like protein [Linnemannia elongata AG-77]|uniref:HCP-like protein n=1 Tax=Linnemannia elongata AG-77 TaxID=1314771 RepID=A0A197JWN4_9FUNG|nr:HCP-like protein [Linnemannia elongata AG-77]